MMVTAPTVDTGRTDAPGPVVSCTDRDGEAHEFVAEVGSSLMWNLKYRAGQDVPADCGGCAICGTCHVYVDDMWRDRVPPAGEDETELLSDFEWNKPTSRLSCQIAMSVELDGLAVTLAPLE